MLRNRITLSCDSRNLWCSRKQITFITVGIKRGKRPNPLDLIQCFRIIRIAPDPQLEGWWWTITGVEIYRRLTLRGCQIRGINIGVCQCQWVSIRSRWGVIRFRRQMQLDRPGPFQLTEKINPETFNNNKTNKKTMKCYFKRKICSATPSLWTTRPFPQRWPAISNSERHREQLQPPWMQQWQRVDRVVLLYLSCRKAARIPEISSIIPRSHTTSSSNRWSRQDHLRNQQKEIIQVQVINSKIIWLKMCMINWVWLTGSQDWTLTHKHMRILTIGLGERHSILLNSYTLWTQRIRRRRIFNRI